MRRDGTPTRIGADGQLHELKRIAFRDRQFSEEFLQQTLDQCPDMLPLDDFDEEYGPLVSLGREIDAIDNLFISPSGRLTLVETKLWRNPEATRTVVAQILDYASRVSNWTYEQLEQQCRAALSPAPVANSSIYELVRAAYPDETPIEHEFHDAVQRTLDSGRFLLLVVGDGIREGLDALLGALHSQPRLLFTFGLVELQVFSDPSSPDDRLVVPHVLANSVEVVRAVVRVESADAGRPSVSVEIDDAPDRAASSGRRRLSEEEFFARVSEEASRATIRQILERARELGAVVQPRKSSVSVRLLDPAGTKQKLTLFVVTTAAEVYTGWLSSQLDTVGVDNQIAADWVRSLVDLFSDVAVGADPDLLTRSLSVSEIEPVLDEFLLRLEEVIESIRDASR